MKYGIKKEKIDKIIDVELILKIFFEIKKILIEKTIEIIKTNSKYNECFA